MPISFRDVPWRDLVSKQAIENLKYEGENSMAKDVTKAKSTDVVEVDEEFEKELSQDAGKGISTEAEDNLVPLIYVLQPLSPQVMAGPAQIPGAKAGDIWLKNATDPIVQGSEGIWFMPATMYMRWTEWIPCDKGGGFVGSHDYLGRNNPPPGAHRDETEKSRPRFRFDNGNECIETRYEAGYVWRDGAPMPYVIPFKSTGHTVSRGWMTRRGSLRRKDGSVWPAWSHVYPLTTAMKRNNLGTWYIFQIGDPALYIPGHGKPYQIGLDIVGGDYRSAYRLGKKLEEAFDTGAKREAPEDMDVDAETAAPADEPMKDEVPY
jgi:hypothetical protein